MSRNDPVITLPQNSSTSVSSIPSDHQHQPAQSHIHSLAALSRNASVISSSSSLSSSSSSLTLPPQSRPRPIRTFSYNPDEPSSSRTASKPPPYLQKILGMSSSAPTESPRTNRAAIADNGVKTPPASSKNNLAVPSTALPKPEDFDLGDDLGHGSYSDVVKATYKTTGRVYAAKIINKEKLTRNKKVKYAIIERDALTKLHKNGAGGHPGIVKLYWTFQDKYNLYFILELIPNGDLFEKIQSYGSLSLPCGQYYTAQIADAVIFMHSLGILHRDLKPENILLDAENRVKITDFGSAKLLSETATSPPASPSPVDAPSSPTNPMDRVRTLSFVGSPGYAPPEHLTQTVSSKAMDYFAIGCILYHILAGSAPFKSPSIYMTMERTKSLSYTFPSDFPPSAKDLVSKLLTLTPEERLDGEGIKKHEFFKEGEFQWEGIWTRKAPDLESGIVKRERKEQGHEDGIWNAFVRGVNSDEDEDGEVEEEEDGDDAANNTSTTVNNASAPLPIKQMERLSVTVNGERRGSSSTATTSSGASPVNTVRGVDTSSGAAKLNGIHEEDWSPLLLPTESVLFCTPIQTPSARRRLSILLARTRRKKMLILTNSPRLLCVKEKAAGGWGLKHALSVDNKLEVKSGRDEKSFVIENTASKTYTYIADDAPTAASWRKRLLEVIARK